MNGVAREGDDVMKGDGCIKPYGICGIIGDIDITLL